LCSALELNRTDDDLQAGDHEMAGKIASRGENVEDLDLRIIRSLQQDARASYRDIARRIGVAVGTVQSRIRKLEQSKILSGFSVNLDYAKLGYALTALILLQVKGGHLKDVESKLANFPNVCVVYDVTGDFDVALVTKFENASSMDDFIKEVLSISFVERTVTSIVLNRVKENYNIPL